jgi:hypothetical protein
MLNLVMVGPWDMCLCEGFAAAVSQDVSQVRFDDDGESYSHRLFKEAGNEGGENIGNADGY